jgi:hypothetical protein
MYIDHNGHIAVSLTRMEGQQLLTLHWCSFSWWGREYLTICFSYKGRQYLIDNYMQPIALNITTNTGQIVVYYPLTLIFMLR